MNFYQAINYMINITRILVFVALALFSTISYLRADVINGEQLNTYCLSENPGVQVLCIGYISGAVDALTTVELATEKTSGIAPQICLKDTTDPEALQTMMIDWLARPKTDLSFAATLLIWSAIRTNYPCVAE